MGLVGFFFHFLLIVERFHRSLHKIYLKKKLKVLKQCSQTWTQTRVAQSHMKSWRQVWLERDHNSQSLKSSKSWKLWVTAGLCSWFFLCISYSTGILVIFVFDIFQADVDGNGTIDYIEFVSATMHRHRLERDEHLFKAFQYFDKDNSGWVHNLLVLI